MNNASKVNGLNQKFKSFAVEIKSFEEKVKPLNKKGKLLGKKSLLFEVKVKSPDLHVKKSVDKIK